MTPNAQRSELRRYKRRRAGRRPESAPLICLLRLQHFRANVFRCTDERATSLLCACVRATKKAKIGPANTPSSATVLDMSSSFAVPKSVILTRRLASSNMLRASSEKRVRDRASEQRTSRA